MINSIKGTVVEDILGRENFFIFIFFAVTFGVIVSRVVNRLRKVSYVYYYCFLNAQELNLSMLDGWSVFFVVDL